MRPAACKIVVFALFVVGAVPSSPGEAGAQPFPRAVIQQRAQRVDQLFNWYYAAAYGTGAYRIGEETVAVLRAPLSYRVRDATDDQWGVRVTVPVTAAVAESDLTDFQLGRVHVAGFSVLPGIELALPLTQRWTLKPFAHAGRGWEVQGDGSAAIYSAGSSALYRVPLDEGRTAALGVKMTFAGYDSGSEGSGSRRCPSAAISPFP